MQRPILPLDKIHPLIQSTICTYHIDLIKTVQSASEHHKVLIVGMKQNSFPKKARQLLDANGIAYHYLEFGSYFSQWRERSALKFWTGWPTFPMIFIQGQLIGGYNDLLQLLQSGELHKLLS